MIDQERLAALKAMPYAQYLLTPEWATNKAPALAYARQRCQLCNTADDINVHHRTYDHLGEEDPSDLVVLCQSCHNRHHWHMKHPETAFVSPLTVIEPLFAAFEAFLDGKSASRCTGFSDLDALGVFLKQGEVTLLSGRSDQQRTLPLLLRSIACRVSEADTHIAFVSLEQSPEECTKTFVSLLADIPLIHLDRGSLFDDDWERLTTAQDTILDLNVVIATEAIVTIDDLRSHLTMLQQTAPADVLILERCDLLELDSSGKRDFPEQRLRSVIRQIKLLARQLRIPIITSTYIPSSIESREGIIPTLRSLKGLDADADTVLLVYREDVLNPDTERKNIVDVLVEKTSNRSAGSVTFYASSTKIDELTVVPAQEE